jgi:hypothetical protein
MLTARVYDTHVEQLFGGYINFTYCSRKRRSPTVIEAARKVGWVYRHAGGLDMLVDAGQPKARSAVHLVFLNEKVRPEYSDAVPASPPARTSEGILLAPVADLVRMKLTSFRLKDRVHIQDLDAVGLIDPAIEAQLSESASQRFAPATEVTVAAAILGPSRIQTGSAHDLLNAGKISRIAATSGGSWLPLLVRRLSTPRSIR